MKKNDQMQALWGTFMIGGISKIHPGYREVRLQDATSSRHATAVVLVLEKFMLENGVVEGDEMELWIYDDPARPRTTQIDIFAKENMDVQKAKEGQAR